MTSKTQSLPSQPTDAFFTFFELALCTCTLNFFELALYNIPLFYSKVALYKFPIHPRTKKNVKKFKLTTKNIYFIEPVSYANFINLQKNAKLVFTDSGGVQEESCILQTPCLTIRNNTERPETVNVGGNIICGYSPNKIIKFANIMFKKKRKWKVPLGAGNTSQIILKHLKSIL